jgi:hypothetical protein
LLHSCSRSVAAETQIISRAQGSCGLAQAQSGIDKKSLELPLVEKNLRIHANSNFAAKIYFQRGRKYERPVNVFNNSVENFVEKSLRISRTPANQRLTPLCTISVQQTFVFCSLATSLPIFNSKSLLSRSPEFPAAPVEHFPLTLNTNAAAAPA